MERDPVCGKEVELNGVSYQSLYDGKVYWFESLECKKIFEADPAIYLHTGLGGS